MIQASLWLDVFLDQRRSLSSIECTWWVHLDSHSFSVSAISLTRGHHFSFQKVLMSWTSNRLFLGASMNRLNALALRKLHSRDPTVCLFMSFPDLLVRTNSPHQRQWLHRWTATASKPIYGAALSRWFERDEWDCSTHREGHNVWEAPSTPLHHGNHFAVHRHVEPRRARSWNLEEEEEDVRCRAWLGAICWLAAQQQWMQHWPHAQAGLQQGGMQSRRCRGGPPIESRVAVPCIIPAAANYHRAKCCAHWWAFGQKSWTASEAKVRPLFRLHVFATTTRSNDFGRTKRSCWIPFQDGGCWKRQSRCIPKSQQWQKDVHHWDDQGEPHAAWIRTRYRVCHGLSTWLKGWNWMELRWFESVSLCSGFRGSSSLVLLFK